MAKRRSRVKRVVTLTELIAATMPTNDEMKRSLLPKMDTKFRKNMVEHFKTEGRSGGLRWAPLTRDYARRKKAQDKRRKNFRGRKILVDQGDLRRSFIEREQHNHIAEMVGPNMYLGSSDPLAKIHQEGNIPVMPERPPLQHTDAQLEEYERVIGLWLVPRFRRAMRVLGMKTARRRRRIT